MSAQLPVYLGLVIAAAAGLFVFSRSAREFFTGRGLVRTDMYTAADAVFAVVLSVFFLIVIRTGLYDRDPTPITAAGILQASVVYVFLGGGVLLNMAVRKVSPIEMFGLRRFELPRTIWVAIGLAVAAYPVTMAVFVVMREFLSNPPPQEVLDFLMKHNDLGSRALVVLLAAVVAPVFEELLFRGFLYGVAKKFGGQLSALAVTGMLFAAIHIDLSAFLPLFVLSGCLTIAYERSGTLWVPILMHATFNSISLAGTILFPDWAL